MIRSEQRSSLGGHRASGWPLDRRPVGAVSSRVGRLETSFRSLDRWRHLPNHQLERSPGVAIERHLIGDDLRTGSRATDHVLLARNRSRVLDAELTTDPRLAPRRSPLPPEGGDSSGFGASPRA